MRIHYLQHAPFEAPANVATWAEERGHDLSGTHLYDGESLPAVDDFDWLIVMGGPMSVHDEGEYPWLVEEKALIAEAVDADKLVLGVCLGAQLLADVLGAEVTEADEREVGWWPVKATPMASDSPVFDALPEEYVAFHWHGDTFEIPDGATWTARTPACHAQAFSIGDRVVGTQFHLEETRESVADLVANGRPGEGEYVQDAAEIGRPDAPFEEIRDTLYALLDGMAAQAEREAA